MIGHTNNQTEITNLYKDVGYKNNLILN